MNWKDHLAQAYEFEKRFQEKMPRTEDLTLQVVPLPERLAGTICFLCGQMEALSLFYIGAVKLLLRDTGYEDGSVVAAAEVVTAEALNP
jgi:hypothetical protein